MPKVSLNYIVSSSTSSGGSVVGKQKGPATDYSMLLEMKRRSIIVMEANSRANTTDQKNGRKGMGLVVDGPKTRGFTNNAVNAVFVTRGAALGFLRF